ncbi:hypothetical protein [Chitinimonas koreensis]|uniref:hypothetical protein n=1 Tax=Chitinimonas koreensis TaxID=356302 RepID=UPI000403F3EF|nr:hypothetical protein [Chitinimonas koreensis]QNM95013.1 hypothetical protein H9L41_13960 [Chitinimonas koreensis]
MIGEKEFSKPKFYILAALGLIGLICFMSISWYFQNRKAAANDKSIQAQLNSASPEQAEEAALIRTGIAEDLGRSIRGRFVGAKLKTMKMNFDASIVCVEFSSSNAWQVMKTKRLVILGDRTETDAAKWDVHCAGNMIDMSSAAQ